MASIERATEDPRLWIEYSDAEIISPYDKRYDYCFLPPFSRFLHIIIGIFIANL